MLGVLGALGTLDMLGTLGESGMGVLGVLGALGMFECVRRIGYVELTRQLISDRRDHLDNGFESNLRIYLC